MVFRISAGCHLWWRRSYRIRGHWHGRYLEGERVRRLDTVRYRRRVQLRLLRRVTSQTG